MIKNFLILILKSARYRPMRSWLTILGIVIGIMLVVMILSLSSGVQNVINQMLQMFGPDLIIIYPGKETDPFSSLLGGQRFKEKDILDLKNIDGVDFVAPFSVGVFNVEYKGDKESVFVHATFMNEMRKIFEESRGVKLASGSWPQSEQSNEVMLGDLVANNLFKNKVRVGDDIIIQSKVMKVSGIFSKFGTQEDDNSIFLSRDIFYGISELSPGAVTGIVKVRQGANIDLITQEVKYQLQKQEVVKDFAVLSPEKVNRIIGNILSVIEFVLVIIAFVSLIVGAVGIMNTMYTSVSERTKQIGVMKAIGASSSSILSLFLIEAGIIGLTGGILGVVLGILAAYGIGVIAVQFGINGLFSFKSLDFFGFFSILIITFITGVVSGILPARRAASMEPAEALRYE